MAPSTTDVMSGTMINNMSGAERTELASWKFPGLTMPYYS